jgi:hypothetical protein
MRHRIPRPIERLVPATRAPQQFSGRSPALVAHTVASEQNRGSSSLCSTAAPGMHFPLAPPPDEGRPAASRAGAGGEENLRFDAAIRGKLAELEPPAWLRDAILAQAATFQGSGNRVSPDQAG